MKKHLKKIAEAKVAAKPPAKLKGLSFQDLLLKLEEYWTRRDCILQQPYDIEVGAGTMHPETFLRVLGPATLSSGLCATEPPSGGWTLRRESQPSLQAHATSSDT